MGAPGTLTEPLEAWSCHQLGLGKLQEEPVIGSSMWNTWGLRCVERSYIAAGYRNLEFMGGVKA